MTIQMSRPEALIVLRDDTRRRVVRRGARLILYGLVGAALIIVVWGARALLTREPMGTIPGFFEASVPFAQTVDPVLPTLITALLALAVVKASRFAPAFVVSTATLCGFLGSMWAVMSVLSLLAPSAVDDLKVGTALMGMALGSVVVSVTVVLTEVLPLSAEVRENQLRDDVQRVERQLTHAKERLTRTYTRGDAILVIAAWGAATLAIVVLPTLGLTFIVSLGFFRGAGSLGDVWLYTAMSFVLILAGFVAIAFGLPRRREDEGAVAGWSYIVVMAIAMVLVLTMIEPLIRGEPVPWLTAVATVWLAVLLLSALVPSWFPKLPRLGLLGQAGMSWRLYSLEKRSDYLQVVAAAAAVDASEDDAL